MTRLLALLLAATATPALAQHEGHGQTADPHAGHQMPGQEPAPDPHAGHAMPSPAPAADPHAGHAMPAPDPHAGHDMGAMPQADPHAGHQMPAAPAAPPVAPPPPAALEGPEHAADTVFDANAMEAIRELVRAEHGDTRTGRFSIDRLEAAFRGGRDGFEWDDVQYWYGTPLDRLWLKSRGEGTFGEGIEEAEIQALWSHALNPWFDLQTGIRADFRDGPDRAYLVLGIQGLAPYWFELDGAAFLSEKGDLTGRIEAEYDQRITQRLILQPRAEVELSAQDVPELGLGSGLTGIEAGLRLRYEFVPEFAPYVGVQYERVFGDTARFARAAGEDVGGFSFVVGLRAWF